MVWRLAFGVLGRLVVALIWPFGLRLGLGLLPVRVFNLYRASCVMGYLFAGFRLNIVAFTWVYMV